jgi:hypothetical protein
MAIPYDSIVHTIGAAAAVTVVVPIWVKWARNVKGSKIIQTVALALVFLVFAADIADQFGFFGPSPAAIAEARKKAEERADRQAVRLDQLQNEVTDLKKQLDEAKTAITGTAGAVTVASAKDCPPGYLIIANSQVSGFGTGVSTNDRHVCIVATAVRDNKTGVELRTR